MRAEMYNLIASALPQSIRHIDLWNEQRLFTETEQPFETPAVFIEFADIQWAHQLHGVRDAVVNVRLHVVTDSRVSDWSDALDNLAIADDIATNLHGLHNLTGIDSLTLVGTHTDHNFDELRDDIETYQCHVTYTPTQSSKATVRKVQVKAD